MWCGFWGGATGGLVGRGGAQATRVDRISPLKYCSQIARLVTQGGLTMRTPLVPTALGREVGGSLAAGWKGFWTMRTAPHTSPRDCRCSACAGGLQPPVGHLCDTRGLLRGAWQGNPLQADEFQRTAPVNCQLVTRSGSAGVASRNNRRGLSFEVGSFRRDWTLFLIPAGQ
jgi:hypothetical protein